jgi:hypothetical protein
MTIQHTECFRTSNIVPQMIQVFTKIEVIEWLLFTLSTCEVGMSTLCSRGYGSFSGMIERAAGDRSLWLGDNQRRIRDARTERVILNENRGIGTFGAP